MKFRRLAYNIDFYHVLTFREQYKDIISPYFGFENVGYQIENENTIHERVRLIFNNERLAIFLRKEGISFIYEGEIQDIKESTSVVKFFWDIFEKVKLMKGFSKISRHSASGYAVKTFADKENVETILKEPPYFKLNPFGKLEEFACVYEFKKDEGYYKFQFGNYSKRDLKNHELSPFNSEINSDLRDNLGLLWFLEIKKPEKSPTFSKAKGLFTEIESIIKSYQLQ